MHPGAAGAFGEAPAALERSRSDARCWRCYDRFSTTLSCHVPSYYRGLGGTYHAPDYLDDSVARVAFDDLRYHHPIGQDEPGSAAHSSRAPRFPENEQGLFGIRGQAIGAQEHRRNRSALSHPQEQR